MGNLYEGSFRRVNFKGAIAQFAAVIIFSLFFLLPNKSYATHAAGSDLTYQWISGNTFRVTVTFYRDCAGIAAPNNVDLNVLSFTCHQNFDVTLNRISGTGQEITFPCNASTTLCNGGSGPGIQQYVYQGDVALPLQCTDWTFSYSICCRNCAITTIVHPNPCNNNNTSPNLYVEATLDNLHFPTASSPFFSNIPEAYLCANQPFTYNQGVIDANGDSLSYKFIAAKTDNNSNVTYVNPFTAQHWISSSPAVSINAVTGDITMTPTVINEVAVACILVTAYRHGVKVGSVIRDMQFRVSNCNPNLLPTATGINGSNNFTATVCPGSTLSFFVNSNDGNAADIVTMTWNSGIPGASFSAAGSPHPTGTFSWTPSAADARTQPYQFTVTVRDNACPNNGFQIYSFTITVPVHSFTVTKTNISCNAGNTGAITAIASGGNPPYAYNWSNSATTQTISGLTAGTYTVSVTDADGCVGDSSIILTQPAAIVLTPSSTPSNCFNSADGTASVAATGGVSPYTYKWSSGPQTTSSVSGLTGGSSYTVSVTDANGCVKTSTIAISQPTQLVATVTSSSNETCNSQSTGTIDLTVSGGSPGYTYKWSNGPSTQDLSGLPAGTYTVTVTDTHGCVTTQSQTITEPGSVVTLITSTTINNVNVACFGDSTGTASVSVSGGTPGFTYEWSNGATDQNISGLKAGSVSVTVTDLNGCIGTGSSTLTEPATGILITLDSVKLYNGFNVSCNGQTDGGIFITVTGGTPGYTYAWSNTATTDDITGLAAGTYTVTVFDFNGCVDTASYTLTAPAPFAVTVTSPTFGGGTNLSCNGQNDGSATANPAGGAAPYTYLWDFNAATTQTITGLSAGTYNVSVVDANGCSGTGSVTLTEPPTIVVNISGLVVNGGTNLACFGDSNATAIAVVSGGTSPFAYAWSNGATIDTAKNLAAGNVTVTVSDDNGCSAVRNFTVIQPDKISITPTVTNVRCAGGSGFPDGGAINLNVTGGTPNFNFNWSNGSGGQNLNFVAAGIYTVTVTDQNSCSATLTDTITQPDSIKVTQLLSIYAGGFNISCNGLSNGSDTLVPIGGIPPYNYFFNFGPPTSDSVFTNLSATPVIIQVQDNNSCFVNVSVTLTEPPAVQIVLTPVNVSCAGPASGSISAAVTGGATPYIFNWSNSDTVQNISELQAGTYVLTVTDANGCTDTASATLTAPLPIIPSAIVTNVTCNGANDGTITLSVSGGTAPYGFQWNLNDDTSQNLTGLSPDTFRVVITDVNGCVAIDSFIITQPDSILLTVTTPRDTVGCGTGGVANAVIVSGGTPLFTYLWSNGATDQSLTGLSASASGTTYSVTVTDANGCSKTDSITFFQASPLTFDIFPQDIQGCFGDSSGSAQAFVEPGNGTPPYSYRWSAPITDTTDIVTGLIAGSYTVTVTDANGCTAEQPFMINQPDKLTIDAHSLATDVQCNGAMNGFINAITSLGGTQPFTFIWNNGATDQDIFNLGPGTYSVTVTDAFGCSDTSSATIHEPPALLDTIKGLDTLGCNTNATDITVAVGGGLPPYAYEWSTGDLTATVTGLAGSLTGTTYSVSVTDFNGCLQIDSITIYKLAPVTVSITATAIAGCNGDSSGILMAVPGGGQSPFRYIWDTPNADTTAEVTGLKAGTYNVTVTDVNGCSATQPGQVTEPAKLMVDAQGGAHDVLCNGANNGVINVNVNGGTAPYSFKWASPVTDTTQSITGLAPGHYTLTVTDAHGCFDTSSANINEPPVLADTIHGLDTLGCNTNATDITVAVGGGLPPYAYEWSTGDLTATVTGLAGSLTGTTYSVSVTDFNGCLQIDSITIYKLAPVTVSITATAIAGCNGDSSGILMAVPGGGQSPFRYIWDTPNADTTAEVTGLKAGTYNVTVTDVNGCSATQPGQVTEPAKLIVDAQGGAHDVLCNGANNGVINVIVNGGTGPYSFKWASPVTDTTQSITGLAPGHYSLTVTDTHGCFDTASANINEPPVLADTLNGTDTLGCSGLLGSITATVAGGVSPYTYNWSTGETTVSISGLAGSASGLTYSVTITDANGCTKTDSMIIVQFGSMTVNLTATPISGCNGDSSGAVHADITGGVAPFKYAWSTGNAADTTADITGLKAGSYIVSVSDVNGCTGTQTAVVTEPAKLIVNAPIGVTNVTCNGAMNGMINVQVNGGTAPYRFVWSAPVTDTTQNITGLAPGTYVVSVTDAHGCFDTSSATITEPAVLVDTITGTDTLACNTPTGGACVAVGGGTPPYTYNWSNGTTNACISGVAGSTTGITYIVTVMDANGCTVVDSITIVQFTGVVASVTATDVLGCHGDTTGTLAASVTGGQGPFHYAWSSPIPASDTNANVINLGAGTYFVTITDKNGCTGVGSATINEPAQLTVDAQGGAHDITCNGAKNGFINVSVSGGTAPYRYGWFPNLTDTTANVTGLAAGTYTVGVMDAHGCTATASATINEPPVLTDTLSGTDTLGCSSSSNGSITVKAGGGVAPYSYQWSNGPITPTNGGLAGSPAGIEYAVTVTDANGCFRTDSFKIVQSTAVIASATGTNVVKCNGDSTGTVTAVVSGGSSPYHYQWDTPLKDTTASVTHLVAGNYQVTITDVNGCSGVGQVTVDQPAPLVVTIDTLQALSCGDTANGSLGVVVTGGVGPYTYLWSNGQTTQNATGLHPGAYVLSVTDANGCSKIAVAIMGAPAPLTITSIVVAPACNNQNPGSVHVIVAGGSGNYSYTWSKGGSTTDNTSGLSSGAITVTVTDLTGGCVATHTDTLVSSQGLSSAGTVVTPVSCHGADDGSICVVVTGGTGPFTYFWADPPSTDSCVRNLAAGTYVVHISDSRGCTNTGSFQVGDVAAPQVTASGSACGGTGTVTGSNPPTNYTGTWAVVSGTGTILPTNTPTAAITGITGTTEVSWIITNGTCSFGDTATVSVTALVANAGKDFTTCDTVGLLRAVPTQGTTGVWTSIGGKYKYEDATSSNTNVSVLVKGNNTFVWTITNGSCSAADTMVITKTDITANAGQDFSTCDSTAVMLHAARPVGATGTWSALDGTKYTFSDASVDSSTVSTLVYGKNVFIWTVTNDNCTATDTVIVTRKTLEECDTLNLEMPTGISPNNDGMNDYFVIHGIESYPTNDLKIYNRWGNLVFSRANYTNDIGTMWYGQNNSGKLLPDGTYFDILTATSAKTGATVTLKQYVDLRRSQGNVK